MKHFWADTHLDQGESIISKLGRPATTPEDWFAKCIDGINACVKKVDIIYLLGDFAFKRPGFGRQQIKCQCYLIKGNHDPGPVKLANVFGGSVSETKLVKCCGAKTWLSHYPHFVWPDSHNGSYHLYGHIHNKLEMEITMGRFMPGRRSMDVSPESSMQRLGEFRPFSEEDIHEILGSRPGHDAVPYVPPE